MDSKRAVWRRGAIAAGIMMAFTAPGLLAAPGDPVGAPFVVPSPNDDIVIDHAVGRSLGTGDFAVAWSSYTDKSRYLATYVRLFKADGTPKGDNILVNTIQSGFRDNAAVAMDDAGDFVVAWDTGSEVWARRFSADGAGGLPLLIGSGAEMVGAPGVAMDADGDFVVGWVEAKGVDQTIGAGLSCYYDQAPCLTVNAESTTIRASRYSAKGLPLGDVAVVDSARSVTLTSAQSGHITTWRAGSSLQLGQTGRVGMAADGSYVIAWSRQSAGNGFETFTQHFSKYNIPDKAQLVAQGDSGPLNPVIAMAPSGEYVLAYARNAGIGAGYPYGAAGIVAQAYTAGGTKLGPQLRVDDGTYALPRSPSVSIDKAGDFIVSWDQSSVYGARSYDARARFFGAGGAPAYPIVELDLPGLSPEFPVVASDAAGNFVGAWFDGSGDNDYSISARLFSGH